MKNGKYAVINSHMKGASHVAKGLDCEDYSDVYLDDKIAIAVISDGHGDKNCFRSAKGAFYACKSAISTVTELEDYGELKGSPDRVITELEKNIVLRWNESVLNDVQENPIQDSELEGLNEDAVSMLREGRRLQKIYGCTLIMACILDDFWFGIQVGDGKCVCVYENGLYSQPIPWDNVGCVGNRSTSICDSKAFENFRYVYGTDIPTAAFVASDGVDESFDENGLNKCYYSLAVWSKTLSDEELTTNFDKLLDRISNGGSGDDVSISGIVSMQKEVKKPVATSEQVAEKMGELFGTLKEVESRYIELRDQEADIDKTVSKVESEIAKLEKEIEEKKQSIEDKKLERDSIRRNLDNVSSQYRELTEQFKVAKERKKQVDDYWKSLGVAPTDTSEIEGYEPTEISERQHNDVMDSLVNAKENKTDANTVQKQVETDEQTNPAAIDNSKDESTSQENEPENSAVGIAVQPVTPVIEQVVEQPKDKGDNPPQGNYKKSGIFGNLFKKG